MADPLDWNYLELEGLLLARLKATVSVQHILSAADLEGVAEAQQFTPAIHVLYFGDILPGGDGAEAGRGSCQVVGQRWATIVAVRNVRDTDKGAAARAEAGPILQKVLRYLSGWDPGPRWGNFRRIPAPGVLFRDGFAYFPILWKSEVVTP